MKYTFPLKEPRLYGFIGSPICNFILMSKAITCLSPFMSYGHLKTSPRVWSYVGQTFGKSQSRCWLLDFFHKSGLESQCARRLENYYHGSQSNKRFNTFPLKKSDYIGNTQKRYLCLLFFIWTLCRHSHDSYAYNITDNPNILKLRCDRGLRVLIENKFRAHPFVAQARSQCNTARH